MSKGLVSVQRKVFSFIFFSFSGSYGSCNMKTHNESSS